MDVRIFCAAAVIPQTGPAALGACVSSSLEGKKDYFRLAELPGKEGRHCETEVL